MSAELAAAVRRLALALHSHETDNVDEAIAIAGLDDLTAALQNGQRRLRWYERDPDPSRRPRGRELTAWSGALNAAAPPMTLGQGKLDDGRPTIDGRVCLDRLREGPPGFVHGGVVAGLFDEVMGAAQRLTKQPGAMTGRLTLRYRRPTPLDTDLLFRAWIEDDRSRRVLVRAACYIDAVEHGSPTAEAEAIFVRGAR